MRILIPNHNGFRTLPSWHLIVIIINHFTVFSCALWGTSKDLLFSRKTFYNPLRIVLNSPIQKSRYYWILKITESQCCFFLRHEALLPLDVPPPPSFARQGPAAQLTITTRSHKFNDLDGPCYALLPLSPHLQNAHLWYFNLFVFSDLAERNVFKWYSCGVLRF